MGIQMMGGNPLESFQTGYNLGSKPNALGTAILGVMDRYQQKQLMDQELGNKLKLAQWESQNITGPAETAKFEREKGWEREKIGLEHKNKMEQANATPSGKLKDTESNIKLKMSKGEPLSKEETDYANRFLLKGGSDLVYKEPVVPGMPRREATNWGEAGFGAKAMGAITPWATPTEKKLGTMGIGDIFKKQSSTPNPIPQEVNPFDNPEAFEEGTIIEDDVGNRFELSGGQWSKI